VPQDPGHSVPVIAESSVSEHKRASARAHDLHARLRVDINVFEGNGQCQGARGPGGRNFLQAELDSPPAGRRKPDGRSLRLSESEGLGLPRGSLSQRLSVATGGRGQKSTQQLSSESSQGGGGVRADGGCFTVSLYGFRVIAFMSSFHSRFAAIVNCSNLIHQSEK
jgi:hypothetical protein